MDLFVIDMCIPNRISHLSGLHIPDRFLHGLKVCVHISLRHIADNSGDTLRHCLCRNHKDVLVLCERLCLVCRKDNVLIVRKDKDMVCIHIVDRCQHIVRTRVHRLTALYDVVHSQFPEDLIHPFSYRNSDESYRLSRLFLFLLLCSLRLLCSNLLRITDQFLVMFLTHVVDLHP